MDRKNIEERLIVFILLVQVFFVCLGVLSRYALGWSLSFTEEFTRYLIVWLACLGFPACMVRNEMIQFRWPGEKPAFIKKAFRNIFLTANLLFFGILLFSSIKMILLQWQYGQKTSVMGWSILWVSLALPVCCLLMFFRSQTKKLR